MKSGSQNKEKAHQSQKKKGYYDRQKFKTAGNKLRRKRKAAAKLAFWRKKGVKKDGTPVAGAVVATE